MSCTKSPTHAIAGSAVERLAVVRVSGLVHSLDKSGVELAFDEVFVVGDSAMEVDVGLDALDDELVESAP